MARGTRPSSNVPGFELPVEVRDVFLSYAVMKSDNAAISHGLLVRACTYAAPIARKRGWKVGRIKEFAPKNASLQGLNVNRGQEICVRTRKASGGFLDEDYVLGTLLHELVHMEHGSHSAQFYDMLKMLWDEAETIIFRERFNLPNPDRNWGQGHVLGGRASLQESRIRNFSFGYRLGGTSYEGLSAREAAARATLARLRLEDSQTCGTQEYEDIDLDELNNRSDSSFESAVSKDKSMSSASVVDASEQDSVIFLDDVQPSRPTLVAESSIKSSQISLSSSSDLVNVAVRSLAKENPAAQPHKNESREKIIEIDLTVEEVDDGGEGSAATWRCNQCSFKNDDESRLCESCLAVRTDYWRCSRCSYVNIADHLQCFTCYTERPAT